MKLYLPPVFFILLCLQVFGEKNKALFHKHTIELALTPAFDYHFIAAPNRDPSLSDYYRTHYKPLGGVEICLAYTYRPIRQLGFSTGLNMLLYGTIIYPGFSNLQWGSQWDPTIGGYNQQLPSHEYFGKETLIEGSLAIPLYIHFYMPLKKVGFEFATGPEFRFPIWYIQKGYTSINATSNGLDYSDKIRTGKYPSSLIRYNTDLCWSFQCGFDISVKKNLNVLIGPELKLINIAYFSHEYSSYEPEPKFIGYTLGIKLGVRFPVGGKNKAHSKEVEKSKS